MSTELDAKGPLALTRFYGGDARGMCLQLTERCLGGHGFRFVSIPYADLAALVADLTAALNGTIGEEP